MHDKITKKFKKRNEKFKFHAPIILSAFKDLRIMFNEDSFRNEAALRLSVDTLLRLCTGDTNG